MTRVIFPAWSMRMKALGAKPRAAVSSSRPTAAPMGSRKLTSRPAAGRGPGLEEGPPGGLGLRGGPCGESVERSHHPSPQTALAACLIASRMRT